MRRLLTAAGVLLLAACGGNGNDPQPLNLPKVDQVSPLIPVLSSRGWKLISIKDANGTEHIEGEMDSCTRDNIFYFNSDGSQPLLSGSIRCYPGEPDTADIFSWKSYNNGKYVLLGGDIVYRVTGLDTAYFRLTDKDETGGDVNFLFESVP